jgi:hypothetical protein
MTGPITWALAEGELVALSPQALTLKSIALDRRRVVNRIRHLS